MVDGDPQAGIERRAAARQLLRHPLTCAEHEPEVFRLIRRHETDLDRWFTQRLGYRLHVDADTARLFKSGTVPQHRPLRTGTGRPFRHGEYITLALALSATAAGPAVISLRDLVTDIRSAAAEAGVELADDSTGRRALVNVLRWMISRGLLTEMHEHVDAYVTDAEADAVLRLRPDRIALVLVPALGGAATAGELLERAERRSASRQWLRTKLAEDAVLYREDLTEAEWGELRRRMGEEERLLDEMFGLVLEARAEGLAAIDPDGTLADRQFPAGGTVGHAALLLIERIVASCAADGAAPGSVWVAEAVLQEELAGLIERNQRRWSNQLVASPARLLRSVVDLLTEVRLLEQGPPGADPWAEVRLLPAAARFVAVEAPTPSAGAAAEAAQESLW